MVEERAFGSFKKGGLRVPPHDIEAEKALLGSVMVAPEIIYEIFDVVNPESFYSERHRIIFKTIMELLAATRPIDLLSVSSHLKEKNQFDSIGGASYIAEISNSAPSASNAKYYAEIVQKKSILRNLIAAADYVTEIGYGEVDDIEAMLDRSEKALFGVTNSSGKNKFISIKDALAEAWERLDKLHKDGGDIRGVPTGFPDLDAKLAGLQKSDLIILAARPSIGKTSLALDIARQAATKHNISVGIFSLEMSHQQLIDRLIAAESRVDAWKLRTGKVSTDHEFSLIRDSLDRLAKAPIHIDDDSSISIVRMRSVARRLKAEKSLDLIIVDYLQLIVPHKNVDSIVQQVTEISRSLKGLARELEIPVLALSQLSRAVEARGGEPRLSDLRDSGCLTGDTKIMRADTGELVQIRDLVSLSDIPVLSMNENYKM
ncbi:MAG: replicative DNA helicase [Patescibacteria group bacterium]